MKGKMYGLAISFTHFRLDSLKVEGRFTSLVKNLVYPRNLENPKMSLKGFRKGGLNCGSNGDLMPNLMIQSYGNGQLSSKRKGEKNICAR